VLVWAAASVAVGALARVLGPRAAALRSAVAGHAGPDRVLTDLAAAGLLACAAWAWLATSVVVVEALRGPALGGTGPRGVPDGVRRVVLAACGVARAGGLSHPAYAANGHRHHPLLDGLPLPDLVAVAHLDRTAAPHPPGRTVVVAPGDSLWAIAERDLPTGSPPSAITIRWHRIYAANRRLIGPDPDRIEPGMRLHFPRKDDA
jgi:nucleoid-associated protein YgaU